MLEICTYIFWWFSDCLYRFFKKIFFQIQNLKCIQLVWWNCRLLFIIPLNACTRGSLKNHSGHNWSRDTSHALFHTVNILWKKPSNLKTTSYYFFAYFYTAKLLELEKKIPFLLSFLKKLQRDQWVQIENTQIYNKQYKISIQ